MNKYLKFSLFLIAGMLVLAAGCSQSGKGSTMVGFWMDNDDNVTTIQEKNGAFVAVTNYNFRGSSSQNTLVSSSYDNGVLTWKYCPPAKPCITMQSVSVDGDTLEVTWKNDNGELG